MKHITRQMTEDILETLLEQLMHTGRIDEVRLPGIVLVFQGKTTERSATVTTGVEFNGEKEEYLKRFISVRSLRLEAAYDADGEEIRTDLDLGQLRILHDEDDFRITIEPACTPRAERVRIPAPTSRAARPRAKTFLTPYPAA